MMKKVTLYPPEGGEGVTPHPSKVEEMKKFGWVLKPLIKKKEKDNGKS